MKKVIATLSVACITISAAAAVWASGNQDDAKAKYSIKQVMKEAHGKKLLNKVVDGSATQEEKVQLLDLYLSLLENEPPMGEADGWHAKAGAVVIAAAKATTGRDGAEAELKAAANCAACHKEHKPPAK